MQIDYIMTEDTSSIADLVIRLELQRARGAVGRDGGSAQN